MSEDCHTHSQDDPEDVPFWKRAPITVGQLYLLKKQLAEALAQKWILFPAQVPEQTGQYLTINADDVQRIMLYSVGNQAYWLTSGVVAWMPLPAPLSKTKELGK